MTSTQRTIAYKMLIGGEMVSAEKAIGVVNPATKEVFAHVPKGTPDHINQGLCQINLSMDSVRTRYKMV